MGRVREQPLHLLKGKWEEKIGLVNKQQPDTLHLFFLMHLEAKLHLLPQRRDTVGKHEDMCFLEEANHFESCPFSHPHYL